MPKEEFQFRNLMQEKNCFQTKKQFWHFLKRLQHKASLWATSSCTSMSIPSSELGTQHGTLSVKDGLSASSSDILTKLRLCGLLPLKALMHVLPTQPITRLVWSSSGMYQGCWAWLHLGCWWNWNPDRGCGSWMCNWKKRGKHISIRHARGHARILQSWSPFLQMAPAFHLQ